MVLYFMYISTNLVLHISHYCIIIASIQYEPNTVFFLIGIEIKRTSYRGPIYGRPNRKMGRTHTVKNVLVLAFPDGDSLGRKRTLKGV